jgi:hypothetical protein
MHLNIVDVDGTSSSSAGVPIKSARVAGGTKSAAGVRASRRSHSAATPAGVMICSFLAGTPKRASFSTSALRGRDVVLVTKACGIACALTQAEDYT